MLKIITVVAALFLLLTVLVFIKQRSMLYQPSQFGLTNAQATALTLEEWPDDAEYRGYLSDTPESQLTIIIFHGNAGEAANRHYYLTALSAIEARIILAEYPGYGSRPGTPSETTLVNDAQETINLVANSYPKEPLIVIGESMGAGVASAATAKSRGSIIQGLVLITPWDSLSALARHYFWYLPTQWLLLDHYDSVQHLESFDGPVVIVVAGKDQIIPAKHANSLYNSISTNKARFLLESAGHNNWLNFVDEQWWNELISFLISDPTNPDNHQK